MQTNLEQVKTLISNLSLEDFAKLREFIDLEEQAKREKRGKFDRNIQNYKEARKWLDENSEEYFDKWVCLEGERLIAVGDDGREVFRRAKEAGIETPFIHFIEKEPEAFWGGWL